METAIIAGVGPGLGASLARALRVRVMPWHFCLAALRGRAGFAPLAIAKASLRMLGQSLAGEFHPKGIHVVHVIIDGQIRHTKLRAREPNGAGETSISPDSIAEIVLFTLKQTPDAWTHEIDLRPHLESF